MTRVRPASGKRAAEAARHGLVKDRLGVKSSRPGESTVKIMKVKRIQSTTRPYAQPPLGYTFVPFGTPPLAERCKLMSKELQYPVFNVSAETKSKHANDPNKLSHHVHRIGYHFKAEVVEKACEALGYTIQKGRFVTETDLQRRSQRIRAAQLLASRGMKLDVADEPEETEEDVRAVMREMFPKMPQDDLDSVVATSWAHGKVGKSDMELPRRIQLGTIARIRHVYTDYDALLKALHNWEMCRSIVERECLAKLIEWRGDDAEDEEARMMAQRVLVEILDDEEMERMRNDQEAGNGNSSSTSSYETDSDVEITHECIGPDLGVDSGGEGARRYLDRYQQGPLQHQQAHPQYQPAPQITAQAYQQNQSWPVPQQPSSVHQQSAHESVARPRAQPSPQQARWGWYSQPQYPSPTYALAPNYAPTPTEFAAPLQKQPVHQSQTYVNSRAQPSPMYWSQPVRDALFARATPAPANRSVYEGPYRTATQHADGVYQTRPVYTPPPPSPPPPPPLDESSRAPPEGIWLNGKFFSKVVPSIENGRRPRASQPIHGAPAPVQQVPRAGNVQ